MNSSITGGMQGRRKLRHGSSHKPSHQLLPWRAQNRCHLPALSCLNLLAALPLGQHMTLAEFPTCQVSAACTDLCFQRLHQGNNQWPAALAPPSQCQELHCTIDGRGHRKRNAVRVQPSASTRGSPPSTVANTATSLKRRSLATADTLGSMGWTRFAQQLKEDFFQARMHGWQQGRGRIHPGVQGEVDQCKLLVPGGHCKHFWFQGTNIPMLTFTLAMIKYGQLTSSSFLVHDIPIPSCTLSLLEFLFVKVTLTIPKYFKDSSSCSSLTHNIPASILATMSRGGSPMIPSQYGIIPSSMRGGPGNRAFYSFLAAF